MLMSPVLSRPARHEAQIKEINSSIEARMLSLKNSLSQIAEAIVACENRIDSAERELTRLQERRTHIAQEYDLYRLSKDIRDGHVAIVPANNGVPFADGSVQVSFS